MPSIRGRLLLVALMIGATSARAADPTAVPSADVEWRRTDRTMLDLLAAGYELVSVVAASPQTRLYFLRTPGTIVKCAEQAVPPAPPAPPPQPQSGATPGAPPAMPPEPSRKAMKMTASFECSELVRASSRRP
ncbi:MAG: hypothetical protein U1E42_04000 [Rhodospirillales bacterium]